MARRFRTSAALGCTLGMAVALLAAPVEGRTVREVPSPSTRESESRDDKAKPVRKCQGKRATIVGTRKANTLIGTPRRDVIWAGAGPDTVLGRGGNDLICGGQGADALIGGPGKDKLYGQTQRDYCHGENREHRNHFKCEVHLNTLGRKIEPPTKAKWQLPPPPASSAPSAAPTKASMMRRAATYFDFQGPVCQPDGSAWTSVQLGNAYFKTQYTNPGYITILPVYYQFTRSGNLAGPFSTGGDWLQYNAPADGQVYQANMHGVLALRSHERIVMTYWVYWWNGAQWVDGTSYVVPHHYLSTTTGTIYAGGMCIV